MDNFLTPVLALIIWSLIIWCVMYARRIPAMQAAKIHPDRAKSPDGNWKGEMPETVQYAAHNYNHLMEQPTIFYALMFYLHLSGQGDGLALKLAWAYVILRVLHSLVQVSVNKVIIRFGLFSLGSLVLIFMALRAAVGAF